MFGATDDVACELPARAQFCRPRTPENALFDAAV
jgi:hypothetical protein